MDLLLARKIEANVDRASSAIFAAAVGYAAFSLVGVDQYQLNIGAGTLAAAAGYMLSSGLLGALATRTQSFSLPEFRGADCNSADELLLTEADKVRDELLLTEADRIGDELVLTEADRIGDELVLTDRDRLSGAQQGPLVLDDIAEAIGPDSRVVRMFDRRAMATAGELRSKIDNHIDRPPLAGAAPDASQELADALAELRKALR